MKALARLRKKVYLYARLSKEEANRGDASISIENQQLILTRYAEEHGFENYEFICDDGISGIYFDDTRPAFDMMMKDTEAGKVSVIIVKDLSRLGRLNADILYLIEKVLPEREVRFITVDGQYDSEADPSANRWMPILSFMNEQYVANTSEKIRAVFQAKGKAGIRLAVVPPYGYRKAPGNPKQLIIDDESASVVKRIFSLCVDGYGHAQIARILSSERILNPSAYKLANGIMKKPHPHKDPHFWNTTTVHKILDASEYLGHTTNFKTWSKSYKDRKSRPNPTEKQLVFENTHPAIISPETWEIVRSMREHKRHTPRYGISGLFAGIVYCSDCGNKLYFHTQKVYNKTRKDFYLKGSYSCSRYRKQTQYQHKFDTKRK